MTGPVMPALERFLLKETKRESFKVVNAISFSTSRLLTQIQTQLLASLVFTSFPTATLARKYSNGTVQISTMNQ